MAENDTIPRPPRGAKVSGRRLWRSILDRCELEEHELALLREAVRLVDQLDELHAIVERDGLMIATPNGVRMNPAAVEARQSRIALARLLAVLRVPDEEGQRPQRRVGVRRPYRLRGVP